MSSPREHEAHRGQAAGCDWCRANAAESSARAAASYIPGWGGYPRPLPRRAVQLDVAAWQQRCWEDHERLHEIAQVHSTTYAVRDLTRRVKALEAQLAQVVSIVGRLPGRHTAEVQANLAGPFPGEEPLPLFVEPGPGAGVRTLDERRGLA